LLICTTWALGLKLFSADPQLEGFIYLAHSYQAKVATATTATTAQKLSDMHHIVINNYTNAGLSILFLLVVYSIIFYGLKIAIKAGKTGKTARRSDRETPYVSVAESDIKISSSR
ncbi:MAG TPA: carbon starvation protein A, partial [Arsenophonus nasoniae]